MSAVTQPVGAKPPQATHEEAIREWLDRLANGECDPSAFLQSMHARFQSDPEGSWEVLSHLD
jgi:hypothetical protein